MYRFARFVLDPQRRVLSVGSVPLTLPPKAVELLVALVENAGAVTTKSELMDRLWPDGFVEEGNLTQYVYLLRKEFSANGLDDAIQTVPRRGYRFTVRVRNASFGHERLVRWYVAVAVATFVAAIVAGASGGGGSVTSHSPSAADRELYLLGRYYWGLRTVPALRRSVTYFKQVIQDAPHSALGYAGLADAYLGLYDYGCDGAGCAPYRALASKYAFRAVAVDRGSSAAHTSLAMVTRLFRSDYARSDAEFHRALALDPGNALAYEWYGNSLLVRGRIDAARDALQHAATLDPVSPATFGWLARTEYYARRYAKAVAYAREALAIDPSRNETRSVLMLAYRELGENSEARRAARLLDARDANGDVQQALSAIERGRYQTALTLLNRAHFSGYTERAFLALDPRLDPVRGDSRFTPWTKVRTS